MSKYSLAKRIVQSTPGLREGLAGAYRKLPTALSPTVYDIMRKTVFRDNLNRLPVFQAAFAEVLRSSEVGDYLEFGVARGTSMIAAYKIASANSRFDEMKFHAFDSFKGLPSSEGTFVAGDMSYSEDTFKDFCKKAGVDLERVTTTEGFFNKSLSPKALDDLGVDAAAANIFHIDCDLYESTLDVLASIKGHLGLHSVIIFDDWFSFEEENYSWGFGEKRAFAEWSEKDKFEPLAITYPWNASFIKVRM